MPLIEFVCKILQINRLRMLEQASREKELDYNRFCSYPISDVLGVCIESQYLYIVQQHKISVYEYHGNVGKPQLSQELIHNEIIKNYCINRYYICIHSSSLIEVRDRKHWENVLFSYLLSDSSQNRQMILDEHSLYISQRDGGNLVFEKIDVEAKEIISIINLGKVSEESVEIIRNIKPMFLNQLGMLNDFYIWTKNNRSVQLGMLYTNQGISKRKFEINQIELRDGQIRQVYHHRVNCIKYPNQSPQYVVIIVEKVENKQLSLHLYEIVPRDHSHKKQEEDLTEFQGKFQGILNQFSFLKNLHQGSTSSSLVQEVFNEAIASDSHTNPQKAFFEVQLEGMKGYQSSYASEGKLWVVSSDKICEIELTNEESIENIVKSYRNQQKVVRSVTYQDKVKSKKFIGLYKEKILLCETTTSYDIASIREVNEEIAEEIEEYEINDEILEKEGQIKINAEADKLRQDFFRLTLQDKEKDIEQSEKEKQPVNVFADCFSQTELQECKTQDYGTQTVYVEEKPAPLGLEEIQEILAKYSSQVSVSCTKVKQNNYIKDKFDREIFNIVDKIIKENVQPYLQSKFMANLQMKIKEISQHITSVFENQLEALNEYMRKNEVKENNLRGKRIFEFSNQVNLIKETVSIIADSLKSNETQKQAFNELILDEAKQMKEEITKITNSITQLQTRNEMAEKEIGDQITQILELVKVLQENRKENIEDSSCEVEECGEESVQREVSETSEQQSISDDSDQEVQRDEVHHRYPPYHHYAIRVQDQKKNKKSFDPLENKGYNPYPTHDFFHAPTQMPYYYPFMPQIPSLPMQGYYPPNYSYPFPQHSPTEETSKNQNKRGKAARKNKKND